MTDVLLDDIDGSYLTLDSRVVKVVATDLMIDAPERHTGDSQFRRALVHDQSDGLTLNFAGDYPGGVTIEGKLHASGPVSLTSALNASGPVSLTGALQASGPVKLTGALYTAEIHPPPLANLIVHGGISYEVLGGVRLGEITHTVILEQELDALRTLISELTTRVAVLEARPH
jgi:hypothetical protein